MHMWLKINMFSSVFQGFSVEGQENIQEILSKQLYLCQFLVAISIIRPGRLDYKFYFKTAFFLINSFRILFISLSVYWHFCLYENFCWSVFNETTCHKLGSKNHYEFLTCILSACDSSLTLWFFVISSQAVSQVTTW